eukprot:8106025-Pyramimonas_sp.AAC.2
MGGVCPPRQGRGEVRVATLVTRGVGARKLVLLASLALGRGVLGFGAGGSGRGFPRLPELCGGADSSEVDARVY